MSVFTPCAEYNRLARRWELIDALLGGSLAMRDARDKWLPMEPKEETQRYELRLSRSVLFEAFKDAAKDLAQRPFSKPVEVTDLPPELSFFGREVDRKKTSITTFARRGFYHGVTHGSSYILVDSPKIPAEANAATVEANRIRPYLILVDPRDVIDKVYSTDSTGLEFLSQVRIKVTRRVVLPDFTEEIKSQVRVITLDGTKCKFETYEKSTDSKTDIVVKTDTIDIPFIPLFHVSFSDDREIWPNPPLEGLAWLNLIHYQSMSDQRNILRIARAGLLLLKGLTKSDIEKDIVFGPNYVLKTTSEGADGKFIEHTGKSIEAGERDLKDTELRMQMLGLAPLIQKTARVAATSNAMNEKKAESTIQAWVHDYAEALKKAIDASTYFFKRPVTSDCKVTIWSNFGVSLFTQAELDTLFKSRMSGDLTLKTYLGELSRRSLLSEDLNLDAEVVGAEAEFQKRATFRNRKPADNSAKA